MKLEMEQEGIRNCRRAGSTIKKVKFSISLLLENVMDFQKRFV